MPDIGVIGHIQCILTFGWLMFSLCKAVGFVALPPFIVTDILVDFPVSWHFFWQSHLSYLNKFVCIKKPSFFFVYVFGIKCVISTRICFIFFTISYLLNIFISYGKLRKFYSR